MEVCWHLNASQCLMLLRSGRESRARHLSSLLAASCVMLPCPSWPIQVQVAPRPQAPPRRLEAALAWIAGATLAARQRHSVARYVVTPELSRRMWRCLRMLSELSDRWKKPFKPRIRPERDPNYYPDDDPRRSRPQFAKFALMAGALKRLVRLESVAFRREIEM